MFKHPVRALSYTVLVLFSLSYPITSVAAWAIKATPDNQQITVQWEPVEGATNYGVCYATEAIANIKNCLNYADSAWPDTADTRLKITGLTNGKSYYFRVLAENASAILDISEPIAAIPNPANTVGRLNDTGIVGCANLSGNNLACPVAGFPNQDAQSGRDVSQDDDSNGHAGFDFTKISATGAALSANAPSWNCVKDNVTGLMWEQKTNDNGLHDQDWTYSWYQPDNSKNGGAAGTQNGGACGGTSACDTDAYLKKVNAAGWCGYKDWRLPSKAELYSIVDYSRYNPAIDMTYFPNTVSDWFWSSSPYAYGTNYAWVVSFGYGSDGYGNKGNGYAVRLVRGGQ